MSKHHSKEVAHSIAQAIPSAVDAGLVDMGTGTAQPLPDKQAETQLAPEKTADASSAEPEKKKRASKVERAEAELAAAKLGLDVAQLAVQSAEAKLRVAKAREA